MKNFIVFIFLIKLSVTSLAQIPNNGFETWVNMGNYSIPTQWTTMNSFTDFDDVYTCLQGSPGFPGTSYIMLTTQAVTGLGIVPGLAVTGTIDSINYAIQGGFPYSQRPQYLLGNWQYMPFSGTDFGYISIILTKWNFSTNTRDTISSTVNSLAGMVMNWSPFSIPLNYQMPLAPDTAQITLSASGTNNPSVYDYLYIDNLSFFGTTTGIEDIKDADITIYPNPAKDVLYINHESITGDKLEIDLYDMTGNKVAKLFSGDSNNRKWLQLNISNIPGGMYIICVSDKFTRTNMHVNIY